jgi:hypothetical protein
MTLSANGVQEAAPGKKLAASAEGKAEAQFGYASASLAGQ